MADKSTEPRSNLTRRRFLAIASLGLGSVAVVVASPLKRVLFVGRSSGAASNEFPGEDSIFHPRKDPREMAREKGAPNA